MGDHHDALALGREGIAKGSSHTGTDLGETFLGIGKRIRCGEVCLEFTGSLGHKVIPPHPLPCSGQLPFGTTVIECDWSPGRSGDRGRRALGSFEWGTHDSFNSFCPEVVSGCVGLQHTDRVKIETGQVAVDDVIWVCDPSVPDKDDASGVVHLVSLCHRKAKVSVEGTAGRNVGCDAECLRGTHGAWRYTDGTEVRSDNGTAMELNEHEQKILDEIERQLYEEDPKLADMVAKAVRGDATRWKVRLAVVAFLAGAVLMFASFTSSWIVAGLGFLIMVGSAGWIALTVRSTRSLQAGQGTVEAWVGQFRRKWRRDE